MGVVKVSTLVSMGMDSKTVYRWCLPGNRWQRLLPGVVLLRNGPPALRQRMLAALLYAGPLAQISGIEACLQHGLRERSLPQPDYLHLLVPHEHKIKSSDFVIIERTARLPVPVVRGDIVLAPLPRATIDAVRRMTDPEAVGLFLSEAVQHGRCAPEQLAWEIDNGTQRGTAIPRRALATWTSLRSVAESRAKKLSAALPVPPSHWNVPLHDEDGHYLGCPDAWWDEVGLAWEIDSKDFHFSAPDYARTLQRNTRYATAGVSVVQTLPSQLANNAETVRTALLAAHRAAAARPRPPVRLAISTR